MNYPLNPRSELTWGSRPVLVILWICLISCQSPPKAEKTVRSQAGPKKEFYVVPGEDEPLDSAEINQGEVLISYSDCYQCHKKDGDATGPSFADIARRYPNNQAYTEFLARKVIDGGSGIWGTPVMAAHADLSQEDAKTMVKYILSLDIRQ